jgi:hypothetical protein
MKKIFSTTIIFILCLFSLSSSVIAQPRVAGDNIYIKNDDIALKITGGQNIPTFSFWALGQNESAYTVKFNKLFEIVDKDGDGLYTPKNDSQVPASVQSLPSLSWNFSKIEKDANNVTNFNITSQGAAFTITFINHIGNNASLKFDVKIEKYTFISTDQNAKLVLGFHLVSAKNGEPSKTKGNSTGEKDRVEIDGAYMESESNGTASGKNINAGLSNGKEGKNNYVYLAFEKFNGTLFHDPTIGLMPGSGADSEDEISGFSLYIIFSASIIFTTGVILKIRRKKKLKIYR